MFLYTFLYIFLFLKSSSFQNYIYNVFFVFLYGLNLHRLYISMTIYYNLFKYENQVQILGLIQL